MNKKQLIEKWTQIIWKDKGGFASDTEKIVKECINESFQAGQELKLTPSEERQITESIIDIAKKQERDKIIQILKQEIYCASGELNHLANDKKLEKWIMGCE